MSAACNKEPRPVIQDAIVKLNIVQFQECEVYIATTIPLRAFDGALLQRDCSVAACYDLMNFYQANFPDCPDSSFKIMKCTEIVPVRHSVLPNATQQQRQDSLDPRPPRSLPPPPDTNSAVVVSVLVSALVLVVGLAATYWYLQRSKRMQAAAAAAAVADDDYMAAGGGNRTRPGPGFTAPIRPVCPTFSGELDIFDLEVFKVPFDDVKLVRPLAEGTFGEVWVGKLGRKNIAIKKLKSKTTMQDVQLFIWEIYLLSKMQCPYIVRFVGVTWQDRPSGIVLLTEYMDGGDLRTVLNASQTKSTKRRVFFSWAAKLKCALHVAEGLVYLHSLDPKVIHRDLKSRNVMLDSKQTTKITDFGVARETSDATMTAGIGTYKWMAPEVILSGHYSESADIFSFGVILTELSTGIVPYTDLVDGKRPLADGAIITKVIAGDLLPSFAPDCPLWFAELGRKCMAFDADERPTAVAVAFAIKQEFRKLV
ncbi:Aste57867_21470 [Aphanomyces stellatus]|uniref:Aste57867_21470 protein n=1 Tax=Aphanomyces stellatus TaxID=120398 RepID=A0A485LIW2_9STRA|nr:hypothetical protein As57867_021401 [Aphanomyces stellatus]VFT98141.1 Aste57867_21470 [Aphanomyces stellatus]